jgi:hypothetical protein
LSDFHSDVLRFAAVRTLNPAVGLLTGDGDHIRAVLRWAQLKRQVNEDVELYKEKYMALAIEEGVVANPFLPSPPLSTPYLNETAMQGSGEYTIPHGTSCVPQN